MSKISYNLKHFIFEEFDGSCGDLTNKTGQIWDETEIGIDDKIGYYMIL